MTTDTQTIQYKQPDEATRNHIAQQRSSLTRSGIKPIFGPIVLPALKHYLSPQKTLLKSSVHNPSPNLIQS